MAWQLPQEFQTLPRRMRYQLIDECWPIADSEKRELTPAEKRLLDARLILRAREYRAKLRAQPTAAADDGDEPVNAAELAQLRAMWGDE